MEVRQYHNYLTSQLLGKKQYELSKIKSSLPTLSEEAMTKLLLTTNDITMYEESSYTLKRKTKEKSFKIQNFISLLSSFTLSTVLTNLENTSVKQDNKEVVKEVDLLVKMYSYWILIDIDILKLFANYYKMCIHCCL